MVQDLKIWIVCCCRNSEEYISKTIRSVKSQTYENYEFLFYADAPTDNTVEVALKEIGNDHRFKIQEGKVRKYASLARWNLIQSIESASEKDIVVLLDGDDWFYSKDTLAIVVSIYLSNKIVCSHGNYANDQGIVCKWSKDYDYLEKLKNRYRHAPWIATHLRTFKYGLVKYLDKEINYDEYNNPFKVATDMALFIPILELSGTYSMYIDKLIYVYNEKNGFSHRASRLEQQRKSEKIIRNKKSYSPLNKKQIEALL